MRTKVSTAGFITPALNNKDVQPCTSDEQLPLLTIKGLQPLPQNVDIRTFYIPHEYQGVHFNRKDVRDIIGCAQAGVTLSPFGRPETFNISYNFSWKEDNYRYRNKNEQAEDATILSLAGLIVNGRCGELLMWFGYACNGRTEVGQDDDLNQQIEDDIHLTSDGAHFLRSFLLCYKKELQKRLDDVASQSA